ncbi:hypothetical protein SLEP1_g43870 [Rubroshorea leprosula]|uniref:Uncharacterized protein n=1 Tax=Rubroshorea leprosula TaxID=152421 RepID=A0AAV5LG33_9ROSI|nr:hypothetical protein SLEP1_g43870 [Rubroshorea leprosula]
MGTLENGWVHFGCSREKNRADAKMAGRRKERKEKGKRDESAGLIQ